MIPVLRLVSSQLDYLVFSLSCRDLMSFSLGCSLWISCLATWFTTATRDAWLFISGSRLSNLKQQTETFNHRDVSNHELTRRLGPP